MLGRYQVTKRYDHSEFSCCFRQWRAKSHCRLLHGYALGFKLTFEADALDENGWVLDFGALKPVKAWLKEQFDHTTIVAADDPQLPTFKNLALDDGRGYVVVDIRIFQGGVGCEKFARYVFNHVRDWLSALQTLELGRSVRLVSVEVMEHGVNSAIYFGPQES